MTPCPLTTQQILDGVLLLDTMPDIVVFYPQKGVHLRTSQAFHPSIEAAIVNFHSMLMLSHTMMNYLLQPSMMVRNIIYYLSND